MLGNHILPEFVVGQILWQAGTSEREWEVSSLVWCTPLTWSRISPSQMWQQKLFPPFSTFSFLFPFSMRSSDLHNEYNIEGTIPSAFTLCNSLFYKKVITYSPTWHNFYLFWKASKQLLWTLHFWCCYVVLHLFIHGIVSFPCPCRNVERSGASSSASDGKKGRRPPFCCLPPATHCPDSRTQWLYSPSSLGCWLSWSTTVLIWCHLCCIFQALICPFGSSEDPGAVQLSKEETCLAGFWQQPCLFEVYIKFQNSPYLPSLFNLSEENSFLGLPSPHVTAFWLDKCSLMLSLSKGVQESPQIPRLSTLRLGNFITSL